MAKRIRSKKTRARIKSEIVPTGKVRQSSDKLARLETTTHRAWVPGQLSRRESHKKTHYGRWSSK